MLMVLLGRWKVAYVKGVSAAVALDISDVILESDAKQVITAIKGMSSSLR